MEKNKKLILILNKNDEFVEFGIFIPRESL